MANGKQMLSEKVANELIEMITIERRFQIGDKLPNENELSEEFGVSRTTLREAIRSLVAHNILEIHRGKGTFVANNADLNNDYGYGELEHILPKNKDIAELRLIIEPRMTALAAMRATDEELETIASYGRAAGEKMRNGEDYTQEEQLFHNAIASATHNDFMMRVVPIINRGVWGGIRAESHSVRKAGEVFEMSLDVRNLLIKCLMQRNAEGAESAMRLHIMLGLMKMKDMELA